MSLSPSNHERFSQLRDEQIWYDFRQGDRDAFSFIYRSYLDVLFNYGMKVIDDRSLVKDSVQEMFIDLWKGRQNLSATDQIRYYLFKALRRKLVREAQKQRRYANAEPTIQESETVVLSIENSLITEEIKAYRKAVLTNALDKISLRQQEVLNLLFFENYSYEEISQLMSINVKSVYTLAWKAFASLRKSLKDLK